MSVICVHHNEMMMAIIVNKKPPECFALVAEFLTRLLLAVEVLDVPALDVGEVFGVLLAVVGELLDELPIVVDEQSGRTFVGN